MHVSLLWRVASNASGEAVTSRLATRRQSTLEKPPQSSRLTLRKRRETLQAEGNILAASATTWEASLERTL